MSVFRSFQIHGGIADDDTVFGGGADGLGDAGGARRVGFVRDAVLLAEQFGEMHQRKHGADDGLGELVGFVRKHGHLVAIALELIQQVVDSRIGFGAVGPAEVVVLFEK